MASYACYSIEDISNEVLTSEGENLEEADISKYGEGSERTTVIVKFGKSVKN
jgi:hypothetical protein